MAISRSPSHCLSVFAKRCYSTQVNAPDDAQVDAQLTHSRRTMDAQVDAQVDEADVLAKMGDSVAVA